MRQGCILNDKIYKCAVVARKLNILKWMHIHHYFSITDFTCEWAAVYNDLEILKWALENGWIWKDLISTICMKYQHFNILDWIVENNLPLELKGVIYWAKFSHSDKGVLWCIKHNIKFNKKDTDKILSTWPQHYDLVKKNEN